MPEPAVEPFLISVPEVTLTDLARRQRATRWPADLDNDNWIYGVDKSYLMELAEFWADGFDWRQQEQQINAYPQYRTVLDGVPVHFIHQRGTGPAPIPLVLTHGWPWTFWFWSKVIRPLADPAAFGADPRDAFDVIVPSVPGFGFSTPLTRGDLNFWKVADIWQRLMTQTLGYQRYGAAGADLGARITAQLGHKYSQSLYGIHLAHIVALAGSGGERPWDATGGRLVRPDASPEVRQATIDVQRRFAAHVAVHVLDSQTIAYGLTDSPVGQLAWLLERWRNWSDCGGSVEQVFSRTDILTAATIYWATESINTSMRGYANAARYPWQPSHDRTPLVSAPTGITFMGYENPPGVPTDQRVAAFRRSSVAANYDIVYLNAHERGGHFQPWENPQAVIDDIRATFRNQR
jgi:pimeloyl-ACP methyl ester carboxylesterase